MPRRGTSADSLGCPWNAWGGSARFGDVSERAPQAVVYVTPVAIEYTSRRRPVHAIASSGVPRRDASRLRCSNRLLFFILFGTAIIGWRCRIRALEVDRQ